jgi:hypothetical protein
MGEHSAALGQHPLFWRCRRMLIPLFSSVLPVFDYRGQVPFVFIACSSDDIFAFDSAALSFM